MPSSRIESLVYEPGALTAGGLQKEIDHAFAAYAQGDAQIHKAITSAGLSAASVDALIKRKAITAKQRGGGITGVEIIIAIAASKATEKVARDLWNKVILPYIRRRAGTDAVGMERRTSAATRGTTGPAKRPAAQKSIGRRGRSIR